jgi:hypothetical protein
VGPHVASEVGEAPDVDRSVVDPCDQRPLERHPAAGPLEPAAAGGHERLERVAPVHRHERVAQLVVGCVERHRQVHGEPGSAQPLDAGDDADGRDREVPGRDADVVVQPVEGRQDVVEVGHRLPHAHEHDVGQPPGPGVLHGPHHLLDDLARGELSLEPGLAGGAEAARHGAARLGGDAHRRALGVVHEHRLDEGAVVQAPEPLHRVPAVGGRHELRLEGERQRVGHPVAHGEREVVISAGSMRAGRGPSHTCRARNGGRSARAAASSSGPASKRVGTHPGYDRHGLRAPAPAP